LPGIIQVALVVEVIWHTAGKQFLGIAAQDTSIGWQLQSANGCLSESELAELRCWQSEFMPQIGCPGVAQLPVHLWRSYGHTSQEVVVAVCAL
jgi:hypothetical protein